MNCEPRAQDRLEANTAHRFRFRFRCAVPSVGFCGNEKSRTSRPVIFPRRFDCADGNYHSGSVFGTLSLATFAAAIFISKTIPAFIGDGGTERWVAYPILLWLTGFGGYLMNAPVDDTSSTRSA